MRSWERSNASAATASSQSPVEPDFNTSAGFTSELDLKARIEAFIAYFNRTFTKPFK